MSTVSTDVNEEGRNGLKRKRGRTGYSCFPCRKRKVKCDNQVPCANCLDRGEGYACLGPTHATPIAPPSMSELLGDPDQCKQFRPATVNSVKAVQEGLSLLEKNLLKRIEGLERALRLASSSNAIDADGNGANFVGQDTRDESGPPHGEGAQEEDGSIQTTDEASYHNHPEATEDAIEFLESAAFAAGHSLRIAHSTRQHEQEHQDQRSQHTFAGDVSNASVTAQRSSLRWQDGHTSLWPSIVDTRDSYRIWDAFFTIPAAAASSLPSGPQYPPRKLQAHLLANLPPPDVLSVLLAYFWNSIDHAWHIVHRPTLQNELQQLQVHLWSNAHSHNSHTANIPDIDPAWLALVFSLLGFASSRIARDKKLAELMGWTESAASEWQERMFAAGRLAMCAADWIHTPSVRILQCMLFMCAFEPHRGSLFGSTIMFSGRQSLLEHAEGENPNAFHHWLSCAIRIGRQLGIDQLGSSADAMPIDDPGWPDGSSAIKRQLGLRLWYYLVILDLKTSVPPLIDRQSYNSPLPARVKDENLGLSTDFVTCEDSVPTDADVVVYQWYMTDHVAQVRDIVDTQGAVGPRAVTDLDSQLRRARKHVTGSNLPIVPDSGSPAQAPYLQLYNLSASLCYRFLRLHRPFFLRALRTADTAAFRKQLDQRVLEDGGDPISLCLSSARCIVLTYGWPALRGGDTMWWWFPAHLFSASIVILLHRLHCLRPDSQARVSWLQPQMSHGAPELLLVAQRTLEEAATYSTGAIGLALRRSAHILAALRDAEAGWLAAGATEPLHDLLIRVLSGAIDSLPSSTHMPSRREQYIPPTGSNAFAPQMQTGSQLSQASLDTSDLDAIIRSALDYPSITAASDGSVSSTNYFQDDFTTYLADLLRQPGTGAVT